MLLLRSTRSRTRASWRARITRSSSINNDTVYSIAMLDLRHGPLRLERPRHRRTGTTCLQFVDAWTNNIAYVGTARTGNRAGPFLIVPPSWTKPSFRTGHTQIHACPTDDRLSIVGRCRLRRARTTSRPSALQQDALVPGPLAPATSRDSRTDRGGARRPCCSGSRLRACLQRSPPAAQDVAYARALRPAGA